MLIQPLLFPSKDFSNESELFFRGLSVQNISEEKISIPAGSTISLETYFNAFSIGKWVEYTFLDNLSLHLKIQGKVEIEAYHAIGTVDAGFFDREHNKYPEQELIQRINEKSYSSTSEKTDFSLQMQGDAYNVTFNKLFKDGILYITIKALDDATLCSGYYSTDIAKEKLNPVKLAVGICTFKREDAVIGNVKRIISEIIDNSESPLADKLEVYIADNGQTLEKESFKSDKIHLFPNPNLGGAGGFTRTMIEAMIYDKAKDFTHIILMDDDILLYPPVLERTYYLLQMVNARYKKAIFGAEMLYLDKKYIQHAAGVLYEDSRIDVARANHKFFNFRNPNAVSANEVVNETNHTGWYYACIPRTIVNEKNLPMPYFIHFDDIEYGIRNIKNKEIYINGISVWHPAFKDKSPFWMIYYDTRNRLITMFSKPLARKDLIKYSISKAKMFLFLIARYEYKRAQLIIDAVQDFLKGPSDFIAKDALTLHLRLLENKNAYISPEEAGVNRSSVVNHRHRNLLIAGIEQLFCNFLPTKDIVLAINTRYLNVPYRAKRLYMYDDKIDKGYVLERNQKAFFKLLFSYIKTVWKLFWGYSGLLHDWQEAKPTLTSLPFWEKYLGLNKS